MTPNKALETLKAIYALQQKARDLEADHYSADKVLCELLRDLGYGTVVDEYELIEKWYA